MYLIWYNSLYALADVREGGVLQYISHAYGIGE